MTDIVKRLRQRTIMWNMSLAGTLVYTGEDARLDQEAEREIERPRERVAELQAECGYMESIKTVAMENDDVL